MHSPTWTEVVAPFDDGDGAMGDNVQNALSDLNDLDVEGQVSDAGAAW